VDARHFNGQVPTLGVGVEAAPKKAEITTEPGHLTDQQLAGYGAATLRQGKPAKPEWHMEGPPNALEDPVNYWDKYIIRFPS